MALSTGAKVAIGIVITIIVVGILILVGYLIYRVFKSHENDTVPTIGSGAVSVAAGAATPNDECIVNGVSIASAFVRYSIEVTAKNKKTARLDLSPTQIPIKALTQVITIDVSKLTNAVSISLLRTVLQSNNFVANSGGTVLTQTSNLGHNITYTDSQIWPICAQFNIAASIII